MYKDYDNGQVPIPRVRRLQDDWKDLITVGMGKSPWCMPEYCVCFNNEDKLDRSNREGLTGMEDSTADLQIYYEIIPHYLVTTAMYRQVVSGSVDHILPPPNDDYRVIEYIHIESEIEPEEDPQEEPEYNNEENEKEIEKDPEDDS